jgi:hypothetical protein
MARPAIVAEVAWRAEICPGTASVDAMDGVSAACSEAPAIEIKLAGDRRFACRNGR